MECFDDCGQFEVTPVLAPPCGTMTYGEETPLCFPCLPRCPKGQVVYCCEKSPPSQCKDCSREQKVRGCRSTCERNSSNRRCCSPPPYNQCCEPAPTQKNCQPTCKPLKTRFVIPCYRYEDGRIERYVPTRYGRLPMSAYRRNGMQDQMHGYRGAIRYLCAGEESGGCCCVLTAVEPLRTVHTKITYEVQPVKRKKDKK